MYRNLYQVMPEEELFKLPGLQKMLPLEYIDTRSASRLAPELASATWHARLRAARVRGANASRDDEGPVADADEGLPLHILRRLLTKYPIYLHANALSVLQPDQMEAWEALRAERAAEPLRKLLARSLPQVKSKLWRPGGRLRARENVAQGVWPADVLTADELPNHGRLAEFMGVPVAQVAALLQ